jgi:hypothetical protein
MRYSTRGVNMPLSSAIVRLNVSFFVISFTCRSCLSSDRHSPDLTPAYDRPSTDQASSAILSLYGCALAVVSSMACHNTGINLQDGRRSDSKRLPLSHGSTCMSIVFLLVPGGSKSHACGPDDS